jgi:hypothetical protein
MGRALKELSMEGDTMDSAIWAALFLSGPCATILAIIVMVIDSRRR